MSPEIIAQIFEICIIPMLGALTVFAVQWIRAKANSLKTTTDNETLKKYMDMFAETISKCVSATSQTYVNTLKAQNKFDADAQKIAFQKTYDAVLIVLNADAKAYITEAVGDFNTFLTQQIEAEVNAQKNTSCE